MIIRTAFGARRQWLLPVHGLVETSSEPPQLAVQAGEGGRVDSSSRRFGCSYHYIYQRLTSHNPGGPRATLAGANLALARRDGAAHHAWIVRKSWVDRVQGPKLFLCAPWNSGREFVLYSHGKGRCMSLPRPGRSRRPSLTRSTRAGWNRIERHPGTVDEARKPSLPKQTASRAGGPASFHESRRILEFEEPRVDVLGDSQSSQKDLEEKLLEKDPRHLLLPCDSRKRRGGRGTQVRRRYRWRRPASQPAVGKGGGEEPRGGGLWLGRRLRQRRHVLGWLRIEFELRRLRLRWRLWALGWPVPQPAAFLRPFPGLGRSGRQPGRFEAPPGWRSARQRESRSGWRRKPGAR